MTSYLPPLLCPVPWKQPLPGCTRSRSSLRRSLVTGSAGSRETSRKDRQCPEAGKSGHHDHLGPEGTRRGGIIKPGHKEGSVATWWELWPLGEGHSQLMASLYWGNQKNKHSGPMHLSPSYLPPLLPLGKLSRSIISLISHTRENLDNVSAV